MPQKETTPEYFNTDMDADRAFIQSYRYGPRRLLTSDYAGRLGKRFQKWLLNSVYVPPTAVQWSKWIQLVLIIGYIVEF